MEIFQHDDGMFARILGEYPLEERRARAQDDLVRSHGRFGAHKSNIHKRFSLKERVERGEDVTLVVVPSQRVM